MSNKRVTCKGTDYSDDTDAVLCETRAEVDASYKYTPPNTSNNLFVSDGGDVNPSIFLNSAKVSTAPVSET